MAHFFRALWILAYLHQPASSTLPLMRREGGALEQEHTSTEVLHTKPQPAKLFQAGLQDVSYDAQRSLQDQECSELSSRSFSFQDTRCGVDMLHYGMPDLMAVHEAEQSYWRSQGQSNPWWAVDTQVQRGKDLPLDVKLKFYHSGVAEIGNQNDMFKAHGVSDYLPAAKKALALDLGCGLGRMGNALLKFGFEKVICVDQADTMLQGAAENLQALAGQGDVVPDVIDRIDFVHSSPELLCSVPARSVDYVHSVLTLQHMKSQLQVAYIEQMCDVLQDGGSGFFQIPVLRRKEFQGLEKQAGDQHCMLGDDKSERNFMAMHYTPEQEVERHLQTRGCKLLFVADYNVIGDWGRSLGFGFLKVSNASDNWLWPATSNPMDIVMSP